MVEALESYSTRFWRRFRRDATPWARDNIVWGFVVLVGPPLAMYLRDRHAQIDWTLIRTTIALYIFALTVYILAYLCRTPKTLDIERDARETALLGDISDLNQMVKEREDTIRALSERPKRTAAVQHDYDTAKKALQLVGEKGRVAMRHIRSHGSLTFGTYSPVLPPGLNLNDTLWVYRHCASEGLLTCKSNLGNSEQTFAVAPKMEKVLDELLFENAASV